MREPEPWYRKQTGTWYVTLDGKQISLGKDRNAAFREFRKLMGKRDRGVPLGEHTVREVLDAYWNWLKDHRAVGTIARRKPLLTSFGESIPALLQVRHLRGFHVQRWINKKYASNGPTSRNTIITTIQTALNWAVKMGYSDVNPIARMEKPAPNVRQEFVPAELWSKVLKLAKGDEFRDFLTVMLASGARPQEMFVFEAQHFDGTKFTLPIIASKGKRKSRVVYLPDGTVSIVEKLAKLYPAGPIFRNSKGKPWDRNAINCRFKRLKKLLGLPRLCATTLRHSYAHHRLTSGQDALTVAKLMGHADTRMVALRYGHLEQNEDFMRAEANRTAFPSLDVDADTAPGQPV